ncbi:hypothetical protein BU26DRAFT_526971 [Trematosphaeria pertusa]|uniref:Uncharacterized protein n=1 Tax=Trematosphaeria pertusa TaxID=390896 RepID=A0A6A6J1N6_9PLEO|nr:uncharacterized protein BU26DRAFT_526971 [Trematosphaeria pertusa]KAF2256639.1 hypothetical protein BU26DRAFT_526971 [Trematosphaeria pertusa]
MSYTSGRAGWLRADGTTSSDEPCAVISSLIASLETALPAQTAFECLDSVPVDVDGNTKLIDELKVVWQWQSEAGWLKNTPEEWENGPLDIEAELDNILNNLDSFSSEYAVQLAIQNITVRTGNFHFNYQPDILQAFTWWRQVAVVSISDDGTSMPKLYSAEDMILATRGDLSMSDISEITQINGEDAYTYLDKVASWEQYIDGDGRLNNLMYKGDTTSLGTFITQTQYDGPSTNFTFANGTSSSFDNFAEPQLSFEGVSDGQSFFDTYCTGTISGTPSSASLKSALDQKHMNARLGPQPHIPHNDYTTLNRRQIPSRGYPDAVVEAESGAVAGYFLTGDGYDDVAVLKIITFAPEGDDTGNEFQGVVQQFLAECVSENKQKLIIDLRENGGGATNLLLDTFMQLFPQEEAFSGQRYRAQQQYELIGDAVNEIHNNADLNSSYAAATDSTVDADYRYWAYWHFRTAQGDNFDSWDEFNGPEGFNDDNFTVTMRYNYSNADTVSIRPTGFDFVDYSNLTTPFNASNVLMYTDALCGSSCASFHEELKNIAGVRAVTVGGRPTKAPIQTVTGSKGGEVIPLFYFPLFAATMLNLTDTIGLASIQSDDSVLTSLANTPQLSTRVGDQSSRLQTQDQIRKGDTTATPLQYIYEASDCKIFYTADTYANPDAAWKQAWDAFQDDAKCVEGSTKHPSSISGGYTPFGPGELQDEDLPQSNGTATTPGGPSGTGTSASGTPVGTGNAAPLVGVSGGATAAVVAAAAVALML